jgi:hypothetical protein
MTNEVAAVLRGAVEAMRKMWRRWRCHGRPLLCCQYVDDPMCNGPHDRHRSVPVLRREQR